MLERVIIWFLVQPFLVQSVQSQNCSQLLYEGCENECITHEVSGRIFEAFKNCTGYESSKMPLTNEEDITVVKYYSSIPSVLNLDMLKQEIELERLNYYAYDDLRLVSNHGYKTEVIKLEEYPWLWFPSFELRNIISIDTAKDYSLHIPIDSVQSFILPENGTHIIMRRVREKYRCAMNFFWYPFEHVVCNLDLVSKMPTNKVKFEFVNYNEVERVSGRDDQDEDDQSWSNLEEWAFREPIRVSKIFYKPDGNYSMLREKLIFQRVFAHEIMQTFVPSLLLSVVSSSSLFVHHELLPARMGVAATTFLSMISLFKGSSNDHPKTAHLKMIDIWILLCYFGAFFCLVEYAYVLYLTKTLQPYHIKVRPIKENEERSSIQKAMKIEKMSRIVITYYTITYPILFSMSCIAHRVLFNDLE